MLQRRDRFRLALEALAAIGIARQRRRQHLQRDIAPKPRVMGVIHLAHPAGANSCDDFIGTEAGVGRQEHGRDGFYGVERV